MSKSDYMEFVAPRARPLAGALAASAILIASGLLAGRPAPAQGPSRAPGEAESEKPSRPKEKYAARHAAAVTAVAFGPDFLATGGAELRIWGRDDGALRKTLWEADEGQRPLAWLGVSADGRLLFVVGRDSMWQCEVDRAERFPGAGYDAVDTFGVTPDGKLWVGYSRADKELWLLQNSLGENRVPHLRAGEVRFEEPVTAVAFGPSPAALAVLTRDGVVHRVEVAAARVTWAASARDLDPTVLAFSPDAKALAVAGRKGVVRLLDAGTGEAIRAVEAHQKPVTAAAWAPAGDRLLTASEDGTVRVWDPASGRRRAEFAGHTAAVRCLAVAPDGVLAASGGDDRMARVWELGR